jgi:thiamine-monophosphate kinase
VFSELTLIREIAARVSRRAGVDVGIGDDAAVLSGHPALIATHDLMVEGVHFSGATTGFADLGHKALAVNLSDVAAMGARPVAALVGLAIPPEIATEDVTVLLGGMEQLAADHGVTIAGGDVSAAPHFSIGVTALGWMADGSAPVLRSGAQPGDILCVTGALGGSAAGLVALGRPDSIRGIDGAGTIARHRRPTPRVAAGRAAARLGVHAMMDCSDGLALDASRIAEASKVAITIDADAVPIDTGVVAIANAADVDPPLDPTLLALTGGEDYELILALPRRAVPALRDAVDVPITEVGRVDAGPAGSLRVVRNGEEITLPSLGWEHRG